MRQKKFDANIPFSIVVIYLLWPLLSFAESHEIHRVVNGEEVYESGKEGSKPHGAAQNKKENSHGEKSSEKGKAPEKENSHGEKSIEPQKEKEHGKAEKMGKYKANKVVTSNEEDPYEIHKPIGIFWFFGVFVILLIVIFVFT